MIVLDASAMVEALIGCEVADELLDALTGDVHAPHLLDVEVLSVLRGLLLGGQLDPAVAGGVRRHPFAFNTGRHPGAGAHPGTVDAGRRARPGELLPDATVRAPRAGAGAAARAAPLLSQPQLLMSATDSLGENA